MFGNLKNLNKGRIRVKLIATMLVMTLTFANFSLVGSLIGESIAAAEDVTFDAYFINSDGTKVEEADINSQEIKLHVSVSLQGEGDLKNSKIELENTNFEFKNNPEKQSANLGFIQSGDGISIEIPVVAKNNESYNLALLNMENQIKLTGQYVDEQDYETDIEEDKSVRIKWTTDSITANDIELNQGIITNKIYKINETENKKIVQMLVTARIKDNKAPVESAVIEINNPVAGVVPESVKVAGYSTKATNGKTYLEFNDGITSKWEYKEDEGKVYISTFNTANENIVSWEKDCEDKYIVTYVYKESDETTSLISDARATMKIHGKTGMIEKGSTPVLETNGEIVTLDSNITNPIYKGNMYLGEETIYETKMNLNVSYNDIVGPIVIYDLGDELLGSEKISYYKSTKINKADALKVLGTEKGIIGIYDFTKTDDGELIQEIVLSEDNEELIDGEYYVFNYEGIEATKIAINFISGGAEGIIEIINEKAIKADEASIVPEITALTTNLNLGVSDSVNEGNLVDYIITKEVSLYEPNLTFDISLNKDTLSTQVENELEITTELKAVDSSNKLFSNPVIRIELPKEITEATLENITPVLYDDELTLDAEASKIVTNEAGNKELVIVLDGEQTKYNTSAQNATIKANLKVKTNEFIPTKNVVVTATCINGAETVQSKENVKLVSKTGLIIKNTVTTGTEIVKEEINKNIEAEVANNSTVSINSSIINNFEENISNINIVGNIPTGATLANAILGISQAVTVYYSEVENDTVDSANWKTELVDYSKVKSIKFTVAELEKGSLVDLKYELNVKNNSTEDVTLTNNLNVNYVINEQAKQEQIVFALNVDKSEQLTDPEQPVVPEEPVIPEDEVTIKITPKTTTNTLHEGQVVTYEIKVTNNSLEILNNVTLDYIVPQGAIVTNLTYAQATGMTFTDSAVANKQWTIETLNPNKSVTKEITLRINDGTTEIVNSASLKDTEGTIIAQCTNQAVSVIEGDLTVRMSRSANMNMTLTNGSTIQCIVMVTNNTQTEMKNLKIASQIPEQTSWISDSEYNKDWEYDNNSKEIQFILNSLQPGERRDIRFEIKVDNLNDSVNSTAIIENSAVITLETGKEYETNIYTNYVVAPKWSVNMTSPSAKELKEGESIKYIIKVTNSGQRSAMVCVEDNLPQEIRPIKTTYYINEENKSEKPEDSNDVFVIYSVGIGETLIIEIEGVVRDLDENVSTKTIENYASISLGDGEVIESNRIVNTIINVNNTNNPNDPTNPGDPSNPNNPNDPSNPGNPSNVEKNTISGLAWLDENKNGIRDNQEKVLQSLKVLLLDNKGNIKAETTTSLTGTYKFVDVENGEYIVVFKYDAQKHGVTKYQVQGATDTTNSDAISRELLLNNENVLVGMTDTIKIENNGAASIDIGLIENPQFDLSLNKYISKVVTTNKEGTKTYEYENTELAKVDLGAKYIAGTVLLVEYEIEVSNDGDVNAYVTDIVDYLPSELEFNSEMNSEWYLGTDNNLHYMALDPQAIEPGKTQTIKLVLTKTLKNNSAGTIENTAEIGEGINLEGIKEIDSTAGNKQDGEDDLAKATLIISIRTGSPIMYIGIVLASMIILGTGIYIIDKKVLRVRI